MQVGSPGHGDNEDGGGDDDHGDNFDGVGDDDDGVIIIR